MKKYVPVIFTALLSILTACSSSQPSTPVQDTPPEETLASKVPGSNSLKFHPLDTETGNENIDVVLSAVASGDAQELVKMFSYTRTSCMTVNALGGPPPCLVGEAEGTIVEVFPSLGGEGSYLRKADIENFPGLNVIGLYAVYENSNSGSSDENFPAAEFGIALIGGDGAPNIVLQVIRGGVVRIDYVFDVYGSGLVDVVARDAEKFILPPVTP